MTRRLTVVTLVATALFGAACGGGSGGVGPRSEAAGADAAVEVGEIRVAAASDLRFAFEEMGRRFTEIAGTRVTFTFGSSGQLAAQIVNGAPFDVFASADVSFVDRVLAAGRGDPDTRATYAFGRIVLWIPEGQGAAAQLEDLAGPAFRKIAVANPDHAPYGRAAVAALRSAGVYDAVEGRLVYGENVSDTLRLATSGNAQAAIVALSLVQGTEQTGRYRLIPEELHPPLEQALVVTAAGAGRVAAGRAFVDLVGSPDGRAIMRRYGFLLPGERPAAGAGAIATGRG